MTAVIYAILWLHNAIIHSLKFFIKWIIEGYTDRLIDWLIDELIIRLMDGLIDQFDSSIFAPALHDVYDFDVVFLGRQTGTLCQQA